MRSNTLTHWALYSAPLLLCLALLWLCFDSEADVAVYFSGLRQGHPWLTSAMRGLTDWCNPVFYIGYAIALFRAYRSDNRQQLRFILILLVVQGVVAGLAVHFLKYTIGRPRPGQGHWFAPLSSHGTQHALPSGHTTEIVGWSLPLSLRLQQRCMTGLFGLFIGLVGFSRIYLGWHHPTDVFFGWLLGSAGAFSTITLVNSTLFIRRS